MKSLKSANIFIAAALLFFISGSSIFAQGGGSTAPFLRISPDARATGMGETGTATTSDINAVYWNPGGLAFLDYVPASDGLDDEEDYVLFRQAALFFSPWLPQFNADLFYSNGTYGQFVESLDGTLAFNFSFMNLGEFTRMDGNGVPGGKFHSNEFALGLAYGTIIGKDLGIGFQVKYIRSNLTPSGSGANKSEAGQGVSAAFDLGLMWKPTDLEVFGLNIEDKLSLGFNLQNIGPKMTYIKESDPLPTTLRLGMGYKLYRDEFNELNFAFDFSKLLVNRLADGQSDPLPKSFISGWKNKSKVFSTGMEWWYQQIFAIRAGYFAEPADAGDRKYWTLGAGIRYDIFNMNFSFIIPTETQHPLSGTMMFSLLLDFK